MVRFRKYKISGFSFWLKPVLIMDEKLDEPLLQPLRYQIDPLQPVLQAQLDLKQQALQISPVWWKIILEQVCQETGKDEV